MNEAPERIWAEDADKDWSYGSGAWGCDREEIHEVEYIRADIHETRVKELELPADDTRSYDKGYTQGYSEGWDDGENMVRVALDEALNRIKELEARLAAQERIAETPVGETFVDTISDFAWTDPHGPMFTAIGKLKESKA